MQVRDQLEVLQAASGELMACSDFMILLRAVLTLGNHLNEGTMRGAASGRTSCLASADTIPGHILTMQRLVTKPSKGTSVYRVLPCRVMLGGHREEGLV